MVGEILINRHQGEVNVRDYSSASPDTNIRPPGHNENGVAATISKIALPKDTMTMLEIFAEVTKM